MGFIGVAIGLVIGIMIYSEVEMSVDCPAQATDPDGYEACALSLIHISEPTRPY